MVMIHFVQQSSGQWLLDVMCTVITIMLMIMPHPKNEANDHSHNCEEGMYRIYNERLVDIHSNLCFCSKQEHTTIEIQERRLAS